MEQEANGSTALRGGVLQRGTSRLSYVQEGSGPVIVLVHGGLGRGSNWLQVADLLADRFTCVMLDRRGHGQSDWCEGPDVEGEADDLLELIGTVGPICGVAGHSYGAVVTLHAACRALAATIPRIVLYEPPLPVVAPLMDDETLDLIEHAVERGEYEMALRNHLSSDAGGLTADQILAFSSNPMFRGLFADMAIQAPTIAPGIRQVNALTDMARYRRVVASTVILLGSSSPTHPFGATAEALSRHIADSTVEALADQTHLALMQAPLLVADAIARHMSRP